MDGGGVVNRNCSTKFIFSMTFIFNILFFSFFSGSFSTVYRCLNRGNRHCGRYVAIKEIDTKILSIPQIRSIRYEINVLSQLQNHENIIRLHCVYTSRSCLYAVSTCSYISTYVSDVIHICTLHEINLQ